MANVNLKNIFPTDTSDKIILMLLVLLFLNIPLLIYLTIADQKEWDEFVIAHECKKDEQINGSTQTGVGFGVMGNGQIGTIVTTTSTPTKIRWSCNDGVKYWR